MKSRYIKDLKLKNENMKFLDSNIWKKMNCEELETVENFSKNFGTLKDQIKELASKEGIM